MKLVDILMATYNGEEFLEDQINSLLGQSYTNWRLLIHDDGSTDRSVSIIKKYAEIDSRIIFLDDGIKCGGAGNNFLFLLKQSTAELITFCDQDDIWFADKIKIQVEAFHDISSPLLVYSNGYTYDGNNITGSYFINFHRTNLQDSIFLNGGIHGCCMMFNKPLLDQINLALPGYIYMHDHFITIAAVTFGKVKYIPQLLMYYRQHANNVTGNVKMKLWDRLKTFLNPQNPVIDKKHYDANVAFYQAYKNQLSADQIKLFEAYISFPKLSKFSRIITILKHSFKSNGKKQLLFKTFIRKAI